MRPRESLGLAVRYLRGEPAKQGVAVRWVETQERVEFPLGGRSLPEFEMALDEPSPDLDGDRIEAKGFLAGLGSCAANAGLHSTRASSA